eukprot:1161775-Pelagomonas_calceolata.AAC.5
MKKEQINWLQKLRIFSTAMQTLSIPEDNQHKIMMHRAARAPVLQQKTACLIFLARCCLWLRKTMCSQQIHWLAPSKCRGTTGLSWQTSISTKLTDRMKRDNVCMQSMAAAVKLQEKETNTATRGKAAIPIASNSYNNKIDVATSFSHVLTFHTCHYRPLPKPV